MVGRDQAWNAASKEHKWPDLPVFEWCPVGSNFDTYAMRVPGGYLLGVSGGDRGGKMLSIAFVPEEGRSRAHD